MKLETEEEMATTCPEEEPSLLKTSEGVNQNNKIH